MLWLLCLPAAISTLILLAACVRSAQISRAVGEEQLSAWQRNIFMLETILILSGLAILGILFYPRRSRYVSRTTRSYNGYGRERELH